MLSTNDLHQISQLLDKKLDEKLDQKLEPISRDIAGLKKDVSYLKKKVNKIDKTQKVMLDVLDREQMNQRKRLTRIEDNLGLTV